jgi:hypothetical protein
MVAMGLGRVKTFELAEFWGRSRGTRFWDGYGRIAAISGRTPMMVITLVML